MSYFWIPDVCHLVLCHSWNTHCPPFYTVEILWAIHWWCTFHLGTITGHWQSSGTNSLSCCNQFLWKIEMGGLTALQNCQLPWSNYSHYSWSHPWDQAFQKSLESVPLPPSTLSSSTRCLEGTHCSYDSSHLLIELKPDQHQASLEWLLQAPACLWIFRMDHLTTLHQVHWSGHLKVDCWVQ